MPTIPGTPTNPGTPTVPTTPTTPGNGSTSPGGGFRPLGSWGLLLESMRVARGNQIEVVAVYKNNTQQRQSLGTSEVNMLLTDSDGVGVRNIGNLYRASGDPDMEPEKLSQNIVLEPGAQARTLALFDIPSGMTPLKTLTVYGYRTRPLTFNVSGLTLPDSYPALKLPIPGAVGGNGTWNDMGDYLVRFDGVRRGNNNALQVFLTTKNTSRDDKKGHPGLDLDVAIIDQDGITIKDEGNLYRASGEGLRLEKISHSIWIAPLGEATVCYPVNMPKGAVAKQLLVKKYYGDRSFTVTLPTIP